MTNLIKFNITVFWEVTPCGVVLIYRRFRETCLLLFRTENVNTVVTIFVNSTRYMRFEDFNSPTRLSISNM